jgi:hypothetical protein
MDFRVEGEISPQLVAAVEQLARAGGVELRGAVFTRPEVVELLLDLVGYTADQPLYTRRLLEPSAGGGAFLLPALRRMLASWKAAGSPATDLGEALCAVELHHQTLTATRQMVEQELLTQGFTPLEANSLLSRWLRQGDFLLTPLETTFDYVVGNPPYVRQERIPGVLLAEYRRRYTTLVGRADLYVPFFERSLQLLAPGGYLGFICADRWMKNQYGTRLRQMIAQHFHLKYYLDLSNTQAFETQVTAYPAITVISRNSTAPTQVLSWPALLTSAVDQSYPAQNLPDRGEPWLWQPDALTALIRKMERQLPTLEEAGCKVGIGLATGADQVFIVPQALEVEANRKLPLAMARDLQRGEVAWGGKVLLNPFDDRGQLVDLAQYPELRVHLEAHYPQLAARWCVRQAPERWYRTIDRPVSGLQQQPKLLIRDLGGQAEVAHDSGRFYPHHNLYYLTSATWDLRCLQAVLLSGLALLFVAAYSTRMRGGFLRFQAQYLRRIRLPHWEQVSPELRQRLAAVAQQHDLQGCRQATAQLYGWSRDERLLLNDTELT